MTELRVRVRNEYGKIRARRTRFRPAGNIRVASPAAVLPYTVGVRAAPFAPHERRFVAAGPTLLGYDARPQMKRPGAAFAPGEVMTGRELLDAACMGAMIALAMRWLFRLDVELHWAVCIGAFSLLLEPWLSLHFGPGAALRAPSDLLMGTVVATAFLGVAQVFRA